MGLSQIELGDDTDAGGNGAVGAKESEIDECPEDRKVIAYLEHGVDGVVGADNVASRCVDPVF